MEDSAPFADETGHRLTWLAVILGIALLGLGLDAFGYWPGIMIDDARWQYQQAVDNLFEDWHPPLMAWIWRQLTAVKPGPAPMLILQLSLYWGGFALAGSWAWRCGRPLPGIALAAIGWLPAPLALMGAVTKDGLMAGCLTAAVGLLLWRDAAEGRAVRAALTTGALAAIALAAAMRFNAFLACVPLILVALPRRWTDTRMRMAAAIICATVVSLAVMPIVNRVLESEKTGVQLSLIMFDLGGITQGSGVNQFPDMGVADPLAANRGCYEPRQWDGYSTWGKKPCPLGFARFHAMADDGDINPVGLWLRAVATHPLAYAEHRLAHFNASTWFLARNGPGQPGWAQSSPNPWGYQVRPNPVLTGIDALSTAASFTPAGWPIFWISVALVVLILGLSVRSSPPVLMIAASAFLFGMGYLLFGVAAGMRYHLWTMIGAGLGAILLLADIRARGVAPSRRALAIAAIIVTVPVILTVAARLSL